MKLKLSFVLLIIMIPAFMEAIDSRLLMVSIPGFPLTLGRSCFILSGLLLLYANGLKIYRTKIFIGFSFIFLSLLIASFLLQNSKDVIKTLGAIFLFVGTYGNVHLWSNKKFKILLDLFFISLFVYWIFKTIGLMWFFGAASYSILFSQGEAINHHIPGLLISISSVYISVRFFYSNNKLKWGGYIVFLVSITACLLIESRSNFLFCIITMLYLIFRKRINTSTFLLRILPALLILLFALNLFISNSEFLAKRFTTNDMNYQERTTRMRFSFIEIGFNEFLLNPLGKGMSDTYVAYKGRNLSIHNQYLTFLVGGGIIAMIGLILLFIGLFNLFWKLRKLTSFKPSLKQKYLFALTLSSLLFYFTLFTLEFTGILFFIITSITIYAARELPYELHVKTD